MDCAIGCVEERKSDVMKDCAEGLCRKDCRLQWKERSLRESACEGIWVEELLWEEMCVLRVPGFHKY